MIIAIPTKENQVDNHFGHCAYYTLYHLNDKKEIVKTEKMEAPQGCGCKSGIAPILAEKGVKVMLAGNMGNGAVNVLTTNHIEVVRGCKGDVNSVIKDYLEGKLEDSGVACASHGEDGHTCSHNHE